MLAALGVLRDEVLRAIGLAQATGAEPVAGPDTSSAGQTHKREIRAVLDSLGIGPDSPAGRAWLKVASDQHALAHRSGLAVPRPLEGRVTDHLERGMAFLDAVLDAFDARYLDVADRLEALAATAAPNKSDAVRLVQEFPQSPLTFELFFANLTNPDWLGPLHAQKLFSSPPAPEVDTEAGRISFTWWPASAYLARMAAADPTTVLEIAYAMPASDNPRVHLDLVDIAKTVPAAKAPRLVPALTRALEGPYLLAPDRYAALAVHLAGQQQTEAAVNLLRPLLAASAGDRAKITQWELDDLLSRFGDQLTDRLDTSWLRLLVDALAVELGTDERAREQRGQDGSVIWFPLLDTTPDAAYRTTQILLTAAVRDSAARLLSADTAVLKDVLTLLDAHPWAVFRRLHLHLINTHGGAHVDLVAQALADPDLRNDITVDRQWLTLAQEHAADLSEDQRAALRDAIETGPDTARWSEDYARGRGETISPDLLKTLTEQWQRDHYHALRGILAPTQLGQLETLESLYGPAAPLDEPPITFTPIAPEPTTDSVDHLAARSSHDLAATVRAWIPEPIVFGGTNQPTYAAQLRAAVTAAPIRHSTDALAFADLDDLYLLAVLYAFKDAAAAEPLDWAGVVALTARAAARTDTPHAHEVHRESANLLHCALTRTVPQAIIAPALADSIWTTLEVLLAASDTVAPGSDPGLYFNDARAQALRAALDWALWRRQTGASTEPFFALLDRLLDQAPLPGADARELLATVLGEHFAYLVFLDADWTDRRTNMLLAAGPCADRAWQAYLSSRLHLPTASRLLDLYQAHAQQATDPDSRYRLALGTHILTLLWQGTVTLDSQDALVRTYYRHTAPATLQQLATAVAAGAREGVSEDAVPRLQAWWQWRLDTTAATEDRQARSELTDVLPALAASGRFPNEWILAQFHRLLSVSGTLRPDSTTYAYLIRVCPTHTASVLGLLKEWITSLDPFSDMPRFRESDIRTLLRIGLRAPACRDLALEIINRAAARGHSQFRALQDEVVQEHGGA